MALTRKMLKAMGIEEDAIEQIIEAHTETTDALKEQRDEYKGQAEKANGLEEELERVRKQLKAALEDESQEELKTELDKRSKELEDAQAANRKLQGEFDAYKADAEAKDAKRRKTEAYKELLEKAGIAPKYAGKVLRVTQLDDIELDEKGGIKDADKAIESIKSEWPEFIAKQSTKGTDPENPPTPSSTTEGVSDRAKARIDRYNERYGIKKEG